MRCQNLTVSSEIAVRAHAQHKCAHKRPRTVAQLRTVFKWQCIAIATFRVVYLNGLLCLVMDSQREFGVCDGTSAGQSGQSTRQLRSSACHCPTGPQGERILPAVSPVVLNTYKLPRCSLFPCYNLYYSLVYLSQRCLNEMINSQGMELHCIQPITLSKINRF